MALKHHLGLEVVNTLDECNLSILDTSKYNNTIPVDCPTVSITAPGFNHPVNMQVQPNFMLNLSGKDVIRLSSSDNYCFVDVDTPDRYECPVGYAYDPELQMCTSVRHEEATLSIEKSIDTINVKKKFVSGFIAPDDYSFPIKFGGSDKHFRAGSSDSSVIVQGTDVTYNFLDELNNIVEEVDDKNELGYEWQNLNMLTHQSVFNNDNSLNDGYISHTHCIDLETDGRFTFLLGGSALLTLKINGETIVDPLSTNDLYNQALEDNHLLINLLLKKGNNEIEFSVIDPNSTSNVDLWMMFNIYTCDIYTLLHQARKIDVFKYLLWSISDEPHFNTNAYTCPVGFHYNYCTKTCDSVLMQIPPTVIPGHTTTQCVEKETQSCLPCHEDIIALNDGIYVIRYSVAPVEKCYVEYNFLRDTKAQVRLAKALCEINLSDCEPSERQKEKLRDLFDIQMMLKAAKAAVEVCHTPEKGMDIYTQALKQLDKIDCKTCK